MDILHKLRALKEPVPVEVDEDDYLGEDRPTAYDTEIPQDEGDAHAAVASHT